MGVSGQHLQVASEKLEKQIANNKLFSCRQIWKKFFYNGRRYLA